MHEATRPRYKPGYLARIVLGAAVSLLLALAIAPNAAFAGQKMPNYSADDDSSSIWFLITDTYGAEIFDAYSPYTPSRYSGMTYDRETNTLTISNVNADRKLDIYRMGENFKINVVGTNNIGQIRVFGFEWGGALEITGSGSLTINAAKNYEEAIFIAGGSSEDSYSSKNYPNSNARLHVSSSVNLTAYAGTDSWRAAVVVFDTTYNAASDAIKFDGKLASPLEFEQINGGLEWVNRETKIDYLIDPERIDDANIAYKGNCEGTDFVAIATGEAADEYSIYEIFDSDEFNYPVLFPLPDCEEITPSDSEWGSFDFEPFDGVETYIFAYGNSYLYNVYDDEGEFSHEDTGYYCKDPLCVKEGADPNAKKATYYLADSIYDDEGELAGYDMYQLPDHRDRYSADDWYGPGAAPADDFGYIVWCNYAVKVGDAVPLTEDGSPQGYTILQHADYDPDFAFIAANKTIAQKSTTPLRSATAASGLAVGACAAIGGATYKATSASTVAFAKAPNKGKVTIPNTVKINGKTYAVTAIAAKAFAKAKKCKSVIMKAKGLTKASVKNCFKGSKVKTVKLSGILAKAKKNYKKWLGKKKVSGKKVKVK